MDYKMMTKEILYKVGGESNVIVVTHCATRLRLQLGDISLVQDEEIKEISGVKGLIKRGNEIQIVIGVDVPKVYTEFMKQGNYRESNKKNENSIKNIPGSVVNFISGTFAQILPIIIAGGLISAVGSICTAFFGLPTESGTYTVLLAIYNAAFYFLPVYVGYGAANKLGIQPMLGALLGGILVHPSINGVEGLDFFGIPVTMVSYGNSIIPVILGVLFMAVVYKRLDKIIPKEVKFFLLPLITMLVVTPVTLTILGPLGGWVGNYMGVVINWLYVHFGWLTVGLMGVLFPIMVMTGTGQCVVPLILAEFELLGFDPFILPGNLAANVALGAAALAVSLKSKDKETKAIALSAGLTGICGITEPSIFGVLLPLKTPFIGALAGGAVGGLFAGLVNLKSYVFVSGGLPSLAAFIPQDGNLMNFYMSIATLLVAALVSFAVTWFLGFKEDSTDIKNFK